MNNSLYLKLTRTALECTCGELGKAIGMTKQSICNYEKKYAKIPKTVYLALKYVFEVENFNDFNNNKEAQFFFYKIEL